MKSLPLFAALVSGLVAQAALAAPESGTTIAGPAPAAVGTVLVTGASRGIGFELTRQYAARGYKVIATARSPRQAEALQALARRNPLVVVEAMDVTRPRTIAALAARYRQQPVDILINNAGILGDNDKQQFGTLNYDAFDAVMETNCKGAIRVTEAFVDNLAASSQKKLMNVSSYVGSIEKNFGGQIFYRTSKACLNMAMRTLAMEFRRAREPGRKDIIVGLIDPGVVDTGFAKKLPIPMITAETSAAGVMARIDAWTTQTSGRFFNYKGPELPW
jgi:NAD(P)-dependent dehydrogenase (short-subunit alcohol dehydrogenase family)